MTEQKICEVPCRPIKDEIDKLYKCVSNKVPTRLFYWIIGGLCFFIVVVIGGAQWKIVSDVAEIRGDLKVSRENLFNLKDTVRDHIRIDNERHYRQEDSINQLRLEQYHQRNQEERSGQK